LFNDCAFVLAAGPETPSLVVLAPNIVMGDEPTRNVDERTAMLSKPVFIAALNSLGFHEW
jgi:hypothetical protein